MRDSLDQTHVHAERISDKVFAVARDRTATYAHAVAAQLVYLFQLLLDYRHGVALVGGVVGVEQLAIGTYQRQLCCGAAAVYA